MSSLNSLSARSRATRCALVAVVVASVAGASTPLREPVVTLRPELASVSGEVEGSELPPGNADERPSPAEGESSLFSSTPSTTSELTPPPEGGLILFRF